MQERKLAPRGGQDVGQLSDLDAKLNDCDWNLISLGDPIEMLAVGKSTLKPAVGHKRRHPRARCLLFLCAVVGAIATRGRVRARAHSIWLVLQVEVEELLHEVNAHLPRMMVIVEEDVYVTGAGFRDGPGSAPSTCTAKVIEAAHLDVWNVFQGVDVAVGDQRKGFMLVQRFIIAQIQPPTKTHPVVLDGHLGGRKSRTLPLCAKA
jgi:hypothetical protein